MHDAEIAAARADTRRVLVHELEQYRGVDDQEEMHRRRLAQVVRDDAAWWQRDTLPGHLTASAFITRSTT